MKRGPKQVTNEKFIEKAIKKHGNKYDYSLVNYINANTKVKIICHKHGIFEQQPNNHIFGQRCIGCMGDNVSKAKKFTLEQWIEKFKNIHLDKYDYSKVKEFNGSGSEAKIIIICKKHGEFLQRPLNHSKGEGCPNCKISRGENEIEKYLIENNINYIREYKFKNCINPKTNRKLPFDFYLPYYNLIIEYHGEQNYKFNKHFESRADGFEGRKYRDKLKEEFCYSKNINYLVISYIEYNKIVEILTNKLL